MRYISDQLKVILDASLWAVSEYMLCEPSVAICICTATFSVPMTTGFRNFGVSFVFVCKSVELRES